MRSFGIVLSVEWQFITDVSGQPIVPFFKDKTLEDGTDRLSRNVGNNLPFYAA
jgi:hypothetical protein